MSHLRAVDGREDLEYKTDVDRLMHNLQGSTGFVCTYDKDGERHLILGGDVDADAVAGYMARCMAALANGDY